MDRLQQILQQRFATGNDVGLYRHAGQHRSIKRAHVVVGHGDAGLLVGNACLIQESGGAQRLEVAVHRAKTREVIGLKLEADRLSRMYKPNIAGRDTCFYNQLAGCRYQLRHNPTWRQHTAFRLQQEVLDDPGHGCTYFQTFHAVIQATNQGGGGSNPSGRAIYPFSINQLERV